MKRVTVPGTDLSAMPLGLGLADFGIADRGAVIDQLLGQFHDAGGTVLDTAHCYGFWKPDGAGCSESCLGDYLKRTGRRDWIVITKGGHPGAPNYRQVDRYLAPSRIEADMDDSLGRLGIDRIDLFFLHRDDPRHPVEELIDYLAEEVSRGRIRYFGASNWRCDRIDAANAYAGRKNLPGFVATSPQWCLADFVGKGMDDCVYARDEEIHWHHRTGTAMFPWHGSGRGYFATNGEKGTAAFESPANRARLERVQQLARQVVKTPNQVALAWLMNQPFPTVPLVSTRNPEHLADALGAPAIDLTAEQLQTLHQGQ